MVSLNDVLLAMSNIPVDDPISEIWGRGLQGGYKIIEYTGALPITISANGDALIDYRIYGVDDGVGEPTENLFDINRERSDVFTLDTKYYIYGGFANSKDADTTGISIIVTDKLKVESTAAARPGAGAGFIVPVRPRTTYTLSYDIDIPVDDNKTNVAYTYIDDNEQPSNSMGIYGNATIKTFTTARTTEYVYIVFRVIGRVATYSHIMLVEGSTAPESYIPYGYKLPMTVGKNLYNAKNDILGYYIYTNGNIWEVASDTNFISEKIPVTPGKKYTLYYPLTMSGSGIACAFFSESGEPLSIISIASRFQPYEQVYDLVAPDNATYFQTSIKRNPGTEPKTLFVEHIDGAPVYIGDAQLDDGEYVSFGEQKIYRDVDGTLTPTDPPVPLPEIPTINGTTVIDYDGDPKPSQMYVKYKDKG